MRSYALQIEDLPSTEQGVRRIRLRAHVASLGTSDAKLPHIGGRIFWITLAALGELLDLRKLMSDLKQYGLACEEYYWTPPGLYEFVGEELKAQTVDPEEVEQVGALKVLAREMTVGKSAWSQ